MSLHSSGYIKNNIKGGEIFKFFIKLQNRKTSKSQPKSKRNEPIISKLPQNKLTGVKSADLIESLPTDLLDSEYDISKENFDSSKQVFKKLYKQKTPTKIEESDPIHVPQRRSTRLKSASFVEILRNDLSDSVIAKEELRKPETSKSKETDPVNIPQRRSTRLKSAVIASRFSDGECDITKEDSISPKLKFESSKNMLGLPQRRSTRLKSAVIVSHLSDNECPITKKDLDSSKLEFEPLKRKFSKSSVKINKTSSNTIEVEDSKKRDGGERLVTQEMAAALVETIDSNIILDMLKSSKDFENSKSFENPIQMETSDQSLYNSLYNSEVHVNEGKIAETENIRTAKEIENCDTPLDNILKVSLNIDASNLIKSKQNSVEASCCRKKLSTDAEKKNTKKQKFSIKVKRNGSSNKMLQSNSSQSEDPKTIENNELVLLNSELLSNSASSNENLQVTEIIEKSSTIPSKVNTRKRKQNSLPATDVLPASSKRTKIILEKRDKPKLTKQSACKKTLAKATHKYTKKSKLTKAQIKKVTTKKIPKDRLIEALNMINNDDHPIWEDRNPSCNQYIYNYWVPRITLVSDQNAKLKYARQFLLRRDWISLSKILCLSNSTAYIWRSIMDRILTSVGLPVVENDITDGVWKHLYLVLLCQPQIFSNATEFLLLSIIDLLLHYVFTSHRLEHDMNKYATLLLAHTDKDQFNKYIQFLIHANDSSIVMKRCTEISKEN